MIIAALVFLFGSFFLQATSSALRTLEDMRSREQLEASPWFRFYRSLDHLFFSVSCAKHIVRFLFLITGTLALIQWPWASLACRAASPSAAKTQCATGSRRPKSVTLRVTSPTRSAQAS